MGQGSPVTPVTPGDELDQASLQEGPPPLGTRGWRGQSLEGPAPDDAICAPPLVGLGRASRLRSRPLPRPDGPGLTASGSRRGQWLLWTASRPRPHSPGTQ